MHSLPNTPTQGVNAIHVIVLDKSPTLYDPLLGPLSADCILDGINRALHACRCPRVVKDWQIIHVRHT